MKIEVAAFVETIKLLKPLGAEFITITGKVDHSIISVHENKNIASRVIKAEGTEQIVLRYDDISKKIKLLPHGGMLTLDAEDENVRLTSSGTSINLPAQSDPIVPASNISNPYLPSLDAAIFSAALEYILPAVGTDPKRGGLARVAIQNGDIVGVDGCRLHRQSIATTDEKLEWFLCRPLAEIALKICDQKMFQGKFGLYQDGAISAAVIGPWTFSSESWNKEFPAWRHLFSSTSPHAHISANDMDCIKTFLEEEERTYDTVRITTGNNSLVFQGKQQLSIGGVDLPDSVYHYTTKYVLDALSGFGATSFAASKGMLQLEGGERMALIAPHGEEPPDAPWNVKSGTPTGRFLRFYAKRILGIIKERQAANKFHSHIVLRGENNAVTMHWGMENASIEVKLDDSSESGGLSIRLNLAEFTEALGGKDDDSTIQEMAPDAFLLNGSEINCITASEVPWRLEGELHESTVSWERMTQALRFVSPAVSTDTGRPYLNCLCMELIGSDVSLIVGTDGHRLAVFPLDQLMRIVPNFPKDDASICLDLAGALALQKSLKLYKLEKPPVVIRYDPSGGVSVQIKEVRIDANLNVVFPPWRGVTVDRSHGKLLFNLRVDSALRNHLQQIAKMSRKDEPLPARLTVDAQRRTLLISAEDNVSGVTISASFPIVSDNPPGEEILRAVNSSYLLDALGAMKEAWIMFCDPTGPIVITPSEDGSGPYAIVMPYRM